MDGLIYIENDESMYDEFKRSKMTEFDISDLGKMRYFHNVEVIQNSSGIFLYKKKYAQEVLLWFDMENCNAVKNLKMSGTRLSKHDA